MKWLRRLSITARITIGSLIVATLFGLGAVEVVRLGVASILHNATVTLLNNDVSAPAEALKNSPSGPFDLPGGGQELAIIGPDGAVLDTTLPSALNSRGSRLLKLGDDPNTVQVGEESYLVLVRDVPTSAGTMHVVAARNTETTDLILARLTAALLIGAGVLVVGFGGASWLLARTALRPVSRMRERAESIADVSSTGLLPVGPAHDELAALATTLNDLIRRLRASADRERQMVSDASHELRTPLAVLRGQLELAELDAGDADALLAAVRSSHTTALRLGQLASNLLELSRIEAGPRVGRTDWRTLTEELADAIDRARLIASPRSDEADAADISIDFDYRPRERQTVAAFVALSATDFGRILDNLLGNAITALTPETPADATTGTERTIAADLTATSTEVILTVRDSGPGMPADFLPVAMDRFTRAEVSRTRPSGGGLGLAIVGALAASAGGRVVLANAGDGDGGGGGGGGGLIVTVVLPRVGPAPTEAPARGA